MGKQQDKIEYVMNLEENAFSSLQHGIEHYLGGTDTDIKFMVLHIFHAVELILKARLAREHPLLLFKKPEEDPEKGHTADYLMVVQRLKNVGVQISRENLEILENLRVTRNKIEHYKIRAKREDIEKYVGGAIKLLDSFVGKELGIHLRDRIKPEIFQEMMKTLYTYEERQKRLKDRMERALPSKDQIAEYKKVVCDECKEEAVWVPDPQSNDETVHCYNCDAKFHHILCNRCLRPLLLPINEVGMVSWIDTCENCWTDIANGV